MIMNQYVYNMTVTAVHGMISVANLFCEDSDFMKILKESIQLMLLPHSRNM